MKQVTGWWFGREDRKLGLEVVHLWNAPEIVIEYLKTGDRKLRAEAQEAAQEARDTAWAATQDDRHAVWAAREKQNKQLTKMVNDILRR